MQYTAAMPIDVAAAVIANRPLSTDYNVLALAAPAIAARGLARPVRDDEGRHAATTRCFAGRFPSSRCSATPRRADRHHAPEQAHWRFDRPRLRRASRASTSTASVRSAVPFRCRPADRSVDGRGRRRTGAVCGARRSASRARRDLGAVLRRSKRRRALLSGLLPRPRRRARAHDRGRQSRTSAAASSAPLERRLPSARRHAPVMVYACGPEGMLAATAKTAARHGRPCQVSVERIMGCGLGGCYSCVVPMRADDGRFITCDRASAGRSFRGPDPVGLLRAYEPEEGTRASVGL